MTGLIMIMLRRRMSLVTDIGTLVASYVYGCMKIRSVLGS